jgi:MerR family mercuric resistance operon transcriptional regulator
VPGVPDPGPRSGQVVPHPQTLRYYERRELLDEPHRSIEGHRHGPGEGAGLQAGAAVKLVDVEAKIADLTVIADTLRAALSAGTHAGQV